MPNIPVSAVSVPRAQVERHARDMGSTSAPAVALDQADRLGGDVVFYQAASPGRMQLFVQAAS